MRWLALPPLLALAACGGGVTTKPAHAPSPPLAALSLLEDDYGRALDEARDSQRPIVAFACASWITECAWLRAFVLTDPAVAALAARFVWLYVDVDKPENAFFVDHFARADPPFALLLDADEGAPRARADRVTSVSELLALLDPAHPPAPDSQPAEDGDLVCVARAARATEVSSPSRVQTLRKGLACANDLPWLAVPGDSVVLAMRAESVVRASSEKLSAIDRSELYAELAAFSTRLDRDQTPRIAASWGAFLLNEAAAAHSPEERAVFDRPRTLALIAAGEAARALALLQQSEHDFPARAEPTELLARAYLALGRDEDALAAVGSALPKALGTHDVALLSLKADVLLAQGQRVAAKAVVKAAVDLAQSLPLYGSRARMRTALEVRLSTMARE